MQLSSNLPWSITVILVFIISISPANALVFSISGGDACVPVGTSTNLSIALSDIPQGLSGLNISIAISDPDAAMITNVTLPVWAELHTISSLPSDQFWLKMVDLQQKVNMGDTNVPVCQISVLARKGGNSVITVTPIKVEDDIGGRYVISPAQKPICTGDSTTTVQNQLPVVTGSPAPTQTSYSTIISPSDAPSPAIASSPKIPEGQPSAQPLQIQPDGSQLIPGSIEVVSQSTTPTVTTPDLSSGPSASPSLMLPFISCVTGILLFGMLKKKERE
jgi:hypothetical protein